MKQSDTYKEIAAAYQIKEFHSRGNVIMRGFRSQTLPPKYFLIGSGRITGMVWATGKTEEFIEYEENSRA